ncbi:hypothetical protein GR7B_00004 [Vibrio phage vB_VcorM_GR7B]|nr:hypothetical protein GR7B_00004 [Vibrio phage vB_VcorM_GR7B]
MTQNHSNLKLLEESIALCESLLVSIREKCVEVPRPLSASWQMRVHYAKERVATWNSRAYAPDGHSVDEQDLVVYQLKTELTNYLCSNAELGVKTNE